MKTREQKRTRRERKARKANRLMRNIRRWLHRPTWFRWAVAR